jgi:beta-glucosidase
MKKRYSSPMILSLYYSDVSSQYSIDGKKGFKAEYFGNKELSGNPLFTRMENDLDHFWQEGEAVTDQQKATEFFSTLHNRFYSAVPAT